MNSNATEQRAGPTPSTTVLICRAGFEPALCEELAGRYPSTAAAPRVLTTGPGYVQLPDVASSHTPHAEPPCAFIFERQRIPSAIHIPDAPHRQNARHIIGTLLPTITRSSAAWTLHAYGINQESDDHASERANRLSDAVLEFCADRFTRVRRRYVTPDDAGRHPDALVMQLGAVSDGFLCGVSPLAHVTDTFPGGMHRMRFDPLSPSRSYLKIEEVFDRFGESPQPKQRVIDLGAAPGGWSYAFLKRGCHVLAVDHGPMRLDAIGSALHRLTHRKDNGITFQPPDTGSPVDWMVSDMLIPPGQTLGMLRKWMDNRWARRLVFNIKLPQQHLWPVIEPIERYLRTFPDFRFQIRQLYHDRREVTVFGRFK